MKLYQIALFLLFASYVYTEETDCDSIANPTKKSDCNEKLSTSDKTMYSHCCYQEAGEFKQCVAVTKEYFDSIGDSKSSTNAANKYASLANYKFDCNAQYLTIGIISLLFFLL